MLLEKLLHLAKKGAEKPLYLWQEEYQTLASELSTHVADLAKKIPVGTTIQKNLENLASVLSNPQGTEFDVAKALLNVLDLFMKDESEGENAEIIRSYIQAVSAFDTRAQKAEFYKRSRDKTSENYTQEKKGEYDKRLFQNEGMLYALEYYLALYKAIRDAPDEKVKLKFIESQSVNLGFGQVPGLLADVNSDEILEKFVYKILADDPRQEIEKWYYDMKRVVNNIVSICDKQGTCKIEYHSVTPNDVIQTFKLFLVKLMHVFEQIGIHQLSSIFFTPYGKKPFIKDIQL